MILKVAFALGMSSSFRRGLLRLQIILQMAFAPILASTNPGDDRCGAALLVTETSRSSPGSNASLCVSAQSEEAAARRIIPEPSEKPLPR